MRLRTYRSDGLKIHAADRRTRQSPAAGLRPARFLVERIALFWTFAFFHSSRRTTRCEIMSGGRQGEGPSSLQLTDGVPAGTT
jgi:hypothetical protein